MTTRRDFFGLAAGAASTVGMSAKAAVPPPITAVPLDDPAIRVIENIWIPMADGGRLAARVFLPSSAGPGHRVGAVLEYLPYRKRDAYRYRDDIVGPILAKADFAFLRVDIRGTGDSDGVIGDEYEEPEQSDALTLIAWVAVQPWCNGKVGMRGISYGSFDALQAADKRPDALAAIVSACGTEQRYADDIHYRGGCLLQSQFDWAMEWQVTMRAPPDPEIVGADRWREQWQDRLAATRSVAADWVSHQARDAKWRYGSIDDYDTLRTPIFHVGGMLDSYVDSGPRMMERAPQVPQKALIGPWTHKWPGYPDPPGHRGPVPSDAANGDPGPGVDWLAIERDWWGRWLAGETGTQSTGPDIWAFRKDAAPGASFPRDTIGAWVSEPRWPSPHVEGQRWFLDAAGLSRRSTAQSLRELKPALTLGFATPQTYTSGDPESWWREQSGDDALSLCFDSQPLHHPLDIMGRPQFAVRLRANRPVAKLFARLTEVKADGSSHLVSHAILNLTHRDSDEAPQPLEPGQDYDVCFAGIFACYRFAVGSRIRVALSESWWPATWPSPEPVTIAVTTGDASHVTLPVRPARPDDGVVPFALYRERYARSGKAGAPYRDRLKDVEISGEPGARTFTLRTGGPDLAETVTGIGTIYGEAYRARRSIREDDPASAEMEAEAINTLRRGDWNVRLRAWCLARCTPTHFLIDETLDAWEGERLVFNRRWEQRIARDMV